MFEFVFCQGLIEVGNLIESFSIHCIFGFRAPRSCCCQYECIECSLSVSDQCGGSESSCFDWMIAFAGAMIQFVAFQLMNSFGCSRSKGCGHACQRFLSCWIGQRDLAVLGCLILGFDCFHQGLRWGVLHFHHGWRIQSTNHSLIAQWGDHRTK